MRFPKVKQFLTAWCVTLLLVLTNDGVAYAQTVPEPMSPPRLVNDYAGLFSGSQRQQLEDSLVAFDNSTSTQIAVVTVNDLQGAAASEYATRILEQWGVGRKGKDNGVVLLIKPRNEYGRGEVFIATGYGVEGALPDITAGRIIDNDMMPYLQQGDYYGATVAGTAAIRQAVRGEYTAESPKKTFDWGGGIFSLVVVIFILIAVAKSYKNGGQGDDDSSDNNNSGGGGRRYRHGPIIFPPIMGGFGGFGGGGHGGGGFGGFGGGMGGGGGAGRSF